MCHISFFMVQGVAFATKHPFSAGELIHCMQDGNVGFLPIFWGHEFVTCSPV